MRIGAYYQDDDHCTFVVWAPFRDSVTLAITAPHAKQIELRKDGQGYWHTVADDIVPGTNYRYVLDGTLERPDPASHFQPCGVHGPSQVVAHADYRWQDRSWEGMPLAEMVIYELHVGTFTPEGTFAAIIPRLQDLKDTGITALEIMPVAQFPGERNWGYDGTYLFAVQNAYGGPEGLKQLIDACHAHGMAVILDVVYNHLGPEGNYLRDFGPYFTAKYSTPWGEAVNFDDAFSDQVRNFFIRNALFWFETYHVDALRLDAVHGICDMSARHILAELADETRRLSVRLGRKLYLIAESDLNDPRVVRAPSRGGFGIDAQWNDDFHHCLHTLLTGERTGYYQDFGSTEDLAVCLREGFVYSWKYSPYRKRRHGDSARDVPSDRFIVFSQNHDQVGNRMLGERLSELVGLEGHKLAAGSVVLSPYIPLLFMGEEYGEPAPFLYVIDHTDPRLRAAVREGRRTEFAAFKWDKAPPDPDSAETFLRSKIQWHLRNKGGHRVVLDYYCRLIALRRQIPALARHARTCLEATALEDCRLIMLHRWHESSAVWYVLNFNREESTLRFPLGGGAWVKLLDSSDTAWNGPGGTAPERLCEHDPLTLHPLSIVLYTREGESA